jgi:hypothetical protein
MVKARSRLLGLRPGFSENPAYGYAEENSVAHLKVSAVGSNVTEIGSRRKYVLLLPKKRVSIKNSSFYDNQ